LALERESEPLPSTNSRVPPLPVVGDQFIRNALALIDFCHIRQGQDADMGVGEAPADGFERRQRHDGVAHPICCPNEQPHRRELRRLDSMRSIAAANSLAEAISRSMVTM